MRVNDAILNNKCDNDLSQVPGRATVTISGMPALRTSLTVAANPQPVWCQSASKSASPLQK